ncbi:MAG: ATP-binding protein [Candidatus Sabulitectum sp.]|nr:ATP-binding protein [Candidatus Sabulitectum sp.]
MSKLVDRQIEKNELRFLSQTGKPEMALLYGRRRVGKTFLLEVFRST